MTTGEAKESVVENQQEKRFCLLENYLQEAVSRIDPSLSLSKDAIQYLNTIFYSTVVEASSLCKSKDVDKGHVEVSLTKVMIALESTEPEDEKPTKEPNNCGNENENEDEDVSLQTFNYFKIVDTAVKHFSQFVKDTRNWTFRNEKEGVLLFRQDADSQESSLLTVKCLFEIEKPPNEVLEVVRDIKNFTTWSTIVREAKVIGSLDNHTQIAYLLFQTKSCLVTTRRDFCMAIHWYRRSDGAYVVVGNSVTHKHCPPRPDVTRANMFHSGFLVLPKEEPPHCGKSSVVMYMLKLDLKDIPNFALRFAQGRFLEDMVQLREFCTRKSISLTTR